jgi:hypothetical protein
VVVVNVVVWTVVGKKFVDIETSEMTIAEVKVTTTYEEIVSVSEMTWVMDVDVVIEMVEVCVLEIVCDCKQKLG